MDFITRLPMSQQGHDSIWVIVDYLTKVAHFLLVMKDFTSEQYIRLFIVQIVRLHNVPLDIVSDKDKTFVSLFLGHSTTPNLVVGHGFGL